MSEREKLKLNKSLLAAARANLQIAVVLAHVAARVGQSNDPELDQLIKLMLQRVEDQTDAAAEFIHG